MTSAFLQFDGSEIVADVMEQMPEANDILLSYGLSCASCSINGLDTLQDGVLGHGMAQEDLKRVLADLNEAAIDLKIPKETKPKAPPSLTPDGAKAVRHFQEEQNAQGQGFRIEVLPGGEYLLDLQEHPDADDKVIESEGIRLFLSPPSHRALLGMKIDFLETDEDAGFKITKA